ncbi:MAG: ABC transporter ATP-binding protein [SAR324 cluster bacterium]|nr:ABC transporter ATP-binding protein [SAR324 cluster bacterium]
MKAIDINNIYKSYRVKFRRVTVLDNLCLQIRPGEAFGFLGSNGAGKTTTLKIITGLIRPTSGSVQIFGHNVDSYKARKLVSFLPEHPLFPKNISAGEFLSLSANLYQKSVSEQHILQLLKRVGLEDVRTKRVETFSKGMRQRLGIAQALLADSQLLLLDEPMSGLDPVGRKDMMELLQELKQEGKTIFFSTHILNDAQLLCDRVAFLKKGKLLQVYDRKNFLKENSLPRTVHINGLSPEAIAVLNTLNGLEAKGNLEGTCHIDLDADTELWQVMEMVQKEKAQLLSISINPRAIEQQFA